MAFCLNARRVLYTSAFCCVLALVPNCFAGSKVLFNFYPAVGSFPENPLYRDAAGNLYGMTQGDGPNGLTLTGLSLSSPNSPQVLGRTLRCMRSRMPMPSRSADLCPMLWVTCMVQLAGVPPTLREKSFNSPPCREEDGIMR